MNIRPVNASPPLPDLLLVNEREKDEFISSSSDKGLIHIHIYSKRRTDGWTKQRLHRLCSDTTAQEAVMLFSSKYFKTDPTAEDSSVKDLAAARRHSSGRNCLTSTSHARARAAIHATSPASTMSRPVRPAPPEKFSGKSGEGGRRSSEPQGAPWGYREFRRSSSASPVTLVSRAPPPAREETIQLLGCTKLAPEERQRRLKEGACFYCGQPGHRVSSCPLKGQGSPGLRSAWGRGVLEPSPLSLGLKGMGTPLDWSPPLNQVTKFFL
ncbi:hypothetical protein L3Q82_000927 [Scortum barcoo]|uniref:Uncharacterized protein n=1 Tax=Scortum barcoo TaxID=214431 RepID=A0ACB8WBP3_9TELE|nr:hypothetical protein L3Q82_000927 [Scortum barcoo]